MILLHPLHLQSFGAVTIRMTAVLWTCFAISPPFFVRISHYTTNTFIQARHQDTGIFRCVVFGRSRFSTYERILASCRWSWRSAMVASMRCFCSSDICWITCRTSCCTQRRWLATPLMLVTRISFLLALFVYLIILRTYSSLQDIRIWVYFVVLVTATLMCWLYGGEWCYN